ncbi:MAG TPA: hypothetical protein VLI04_11300 [Nocardioidaceae bacterium]|nr:hypothetical protein [Nocardioidaceae bacterium]
MKRSIIALLAALGLVLPIGSATAQEPLPTAFLLAFVTDGPIIRAGEPVDLSATLVLENTTTPVPAADVLLQVKPYGVDTFSTKAALQTDAQGHVGISVTSTKTYRYRFVFAGNLAFAASSTGPVVQKLGSFATIKISDRTPAVGQRVVVSGRTKPVKAGHTVWLYRGRSAHGAFTGPNGNKHVLLAKSVVGKDGRYRIPVRFEGDGRKRLFVDIAAGGGNLLGYSDYLRVTVH